MLCTVGDVIVYFPKIVSLVSWQRENHIQRQRGEPEEEAVICVLYPTNMLNCSWSFHTLEKDAQLSVSIRVSESYDLVDSRNQDSAQRVGFMSWMLHDGEDKSVVITFNVTLRDAWICCTASFDDDLLSKSQRLTLFLLSS
ncbi:hypothetical protein XENOCAPTIV_011994 [Xenoophorus captivus]|uniref:Uncharacterized protein n=1 Tax=Xenoophorus captivus TaxID=1517983 RepID=A0ABV0QRD7_9TELE